MKRLLIVLAAIAFSAALYGQKNYVIGGAIISDTVKATGTATVTLYEELFDQCDVSLQIVPTSTSGDSVNCAIAIWQSNTVGGTAYTEITAKRDTITGTTGILIDIADYPGIKLRIIGTGITTDSLTFTVYPLYKQPRVK